MLANYTTKQNNPKQSQLKYPPITIQTLLIKDEDNIKMLLKNVDSLKRELEMVRKAKREAEQDMVRVMDN